MDKRKYSRSGLHLSEAAARNKAGRPVYGRVLLVLMRAVIVWLLASAWWNSFLAVFPVNVAVDWLYILLLPFAFTGAVLAGLSRKKQWIGAISYLAAGGVFIWQKPGFAAAVINHLANAYLRIHEQGSEPLLLYKEPAIAGWLFGFLAAMATAPLLWLWARVLIRNRGKALAGALIIVPVLIAAVEGYFPPSGACWFLILCTGMYLAGSGSNSGKSAVCSAAAALFCLLALWFLSSAIAKPIESAKAAEGGLYSQARDAVSQNVVEKLKDITGRSAEEQKEEKAKKEEEEEKTPAKQPDTEDSPQAVPSGTEEEAVYGGQEFEGLKKWAGHDSPEGFLSNGAENLKLIEGFSPGNGDGITLKLSERPQSTVYYAMGYGGAYNGERWDMNPPGNELYPEYSAYPESLSRLAALCQSEEVVSVEEASRFIQHEFEENTVYDYRPGATPDGRDFAEYFLFDNKKGFCVHFATTATLMYRMFGFQARYAQGYAVEASAFQEQEDGTYAAEVTGEMGHAWSETYEDGRWAVQEHTLPYLGEEPQALAPAAANEHAGQEKESGGVTGIAKVLGVTAAILCILAVSACVFLIQGALRRKKRRAQCKLYWQGRGILALYKNLFDIAVFLGMEAREDMDTQTFEALKRVLPEISAEEWEWIQELVWRTMFARKLPSLEEHARLYGMVGKLAGDVGKDLAGWKKVKYHNVKCLG